jgi:hypothetical protein
MTWSEWGERPRQQKQPTILIAVALAHDQSLFPEAHHNGSLSFKYIPPVPTVKMVSWLRSMTRHWDAFESEFDLAEAAVVQTLMKAIRDAGSPLDAWEEWLLLVEEAPGVLMVATAANPVPGPSPNGEDGARQGERRGEPEADHLVSFLHHLKPGEGQEILLGFGSLNPADNRLVCVYWDDMLQGLVSSECSRVSVRK